MPNEDKNEEELIGLDSEYLSDKFCFCATMGAVLPFVLLIASCLVFPGLEILFRRELFKSMYTDTIFTFITSSGFEMCLLLLMYASIYFHFSNLMIVNVNVINKQIYIISCIATHMLLIALSSIVMLYIVTSSLTEKPMDRSKAISVIGTIHQKPYHLTVNEETLEEKIARITDVQEHDKVLSNKDIDKLIKSLSTVVEETFNLPEGANDTIYSTYIDYYGISYDTSDRSYADIRVGEVPYAIIDNILLSGALNIEDDFKEDLMYILLVNWLDKGYEKI